MNKPSPKSGRSVQRTQPSQKIEDDGLAWSTSSLYDALPPMTMETSTGPPYFESSRSPPPSTLDPAPVSYASLSSSQPTPSADANTTSNTKPALSIAPHMDFLDRVPDRSYDRSSRQSSIPTNQPAFFIPDYVYYPSPLLSTSELDHPYPSPMSPYFPYMHPSPSTPDGFRYGSSLMGSNGGNVGNAGSAAGVGAGVGGPGANNGPAGIDWTSTFPPLMGTGTLGGALGLAPYSTFEQPQGPSGFWMSGSPISQHGQLPSRRLSSGIPLGKNGGPRRFSTQQQPGFMSSPLSPGLAYHPSNSRNAGFPSSPLMTSSFPPFGSSIPLPPPLPPLLHSRFSHDASAVEMIPIQLQSSGAGANSFGSKRSGRQNRNTSAGRTPPTPSSHAYTQSIGGQAQGGQHAQTKDPRSRLLINFREDKTKAWELEDIVGHISEFAQDQYGSRFIQLKLETASEAIKQAVFQEVLSNVYTLETDVFGNYVVQKFFEYGTPAQKTTLAETMRGSMLTLSLDPYGCRSVQKALDHISEAQAVSLVSELEDHILTCVKSSNANHVIQRIASIPNSGLNLADAFRGQVYNMCSHPFGCRVFQKCLEFLPADQVRTLADEMNQYTRDLACDQFGNYVVQFVLEKGSLQDKTHIVQNFKGHIVQLARHKFASNVCEKVLVHASPEERESLINELSVSGPGNSLSLLMKDQYGNFVVQRALRTAEPAQRDKLVIELQPIFESMRSSQSFPYQKPLTCLDRLLKELYPDGLPGSEVPNTTPSASVSVDANLGPTAPASTVVAAAPPASTVAAASSS